VSKARDYKAEYRRRVQRGLYRGLSRAASRGHAKAGEIKTKPGGRAISPTNPLHRAFERVKDGESLTQTAKALRIAPERLRRYLAENAEVRRERGRLTVVRDRRRFLLPLYTSGRLRKVTVDADNAQVLGRYMGAVGRFLSTNDIGRLAPFEGHGVVNVNGQFLPFETDPNRLYALDAKGELEFHQVYQIQS
jgi:hypothetical protein